MEFSLMFLKIFAFGIKLALPLLLLFIVIISVLGLMVARRENWSRQDGLYYAFITATTVGYGDFSPVKPLSRFYAIIIAFMGLIFTGIFVALAIHAASTAFKSTENIPALEAQMKKVIHFKPANPR